MTVSTSWCPCHLQLPPEWSETYAQIHATPSIKHQPPHSFQKNILFFLSPDKLQGYIVHTISTLHSHVSRRPHCMDSQSTKTWPYQRSKNHHKCALNILEVWYTWSNANQQEVTLQLLITIYTTIRLGYSVKNTTNFMELRMPAVLWTIGSQWGCH